MLKIKLYFSKVIWSYSLVDTWKIPVLFNIKNEICPDYIQLRMDFN